MNDSKLVQGYECLSACLGHIFSCKYPEITGSDVCILGGGMDVYYDASEHILSTPLYESNYVFLNDNNIEFENNKSDALGAESTITNHIENGLQQIIKVNSHDLTYNRVFRQSNHSTHYVIVDSEIQGKYHIIDCYVPTREPSVFEGYISKEEILRAWKNKEYEYIVMENVEINLDLLKKRMWETIVKHIRDYCGIDTSIVANRGEQAVYNAILYLGEQMHNSNFYELAKKTNYQFRIYGFISSKYMLQSVLERNKAFDELCSLYRQVIHDWNNICFLIIKIGIGRKKELYDQLLYKVERVLKDEKQILLNIYELLLKENQWLEE